MTCALNSGFEGMDIGKPKLYGMNRWYIPNANADIMREKNVNKWGDPSGK